MYIKTTCILSALIICASITPALADSDKGRDPEAVAALEFERRDDGKCHILSEGGKLMLMHNKHAEKSVKFRLIRYFANVRQQGRVTGVAVQGEKPVKLGCTLVDGREQTWKVERATFIDPASGQTSN